METKNNVKIINNLEKAILANVKKSWAPFLLEQKSQSYYEPLILKLTDDYCNKTIYPELNDILKPMKLLNPEDIKVVIIGQDPYHTPGVADGLAFSSKQTKIPPSLKNIFKEIQADVGIENSSPNLINWANQGVFLINSVLSVQEGKAKSHHKIGWKDFVVNLIKYIDNRGSYIFVLWGNDAQKYEEYLTNAIVIKGVHPSPLAGGGFFGGKYFSKINYILEKQGKDTIDWRTTNEI